jgi:UDP-N-acetylglucosamine 2-epimerase (non-hydrolysing)
VEAGCARLVGPNREAIVREASRLLADPAAAAAMRTAGNPFGDGQASRRIAEAVLARLRIRSEKIAPATPAFPDTQAALAA